MKKLLLLIVCAIVVCACGGSKPQPTEESKTLPASSLILKGKHAKLFKLAGDTYTVNLVKADGSWQVRIKMTIATNTPFEQIKNSHTFDRALQGPYGKLLNGSDVELESLDMSKSDWETLIQEDEETELTVSGKTWSYKRFEYEKAKEIFDNTVAVEISGLELVQAKKSNSSKLIDDETKETIDDMKDILEAEGEMLNALKGLL